MAPALAYADQSAAQLRLTVVRGPVDETQFRVLARATLDCAGVRVRAGIIGASHFLAIEADGGAWTEVLACADVATDAPGRVYADPLAAPRSIPVPDGSGAAAYRFRARRLAGAGGRTLAGAVEREANAARGRPGEIGLVRTFPRSEPGPAPKTVVRAEWDSPRDRVRWRTVHSYPNEDTVVITRSSISIRNLRRVAHG